MSSHAQDVDGRAVRAAAFEPPAEFDDYVILRRLGQGATGHVYLAEDAVLARPIAIKFIGAAPDPVSRQQFLMEARAAARIQHPNVVSIYRVGELGDQPYIVSELVRGTALSDEPRPMAWAKALAIAIDVGRGLAAAHRRGVVHCDIKPSNVMMTEDGVAKLVDFGLARVVREGARDGSMDARGLSGTPDYMAPEVWRGEPPSRRSDVYSVGAVLFELIQGAPPFTGVALGELGEVVNARDAPGLDTEPRVAALIARCLARDPAARFAGGEELREAVERLTAVGDARARSDENPYRGLRPFESSHRGVFFGRGLEVGALVERLRTESVVVVAGDSGVGKSSLCRAGVVPAVVDGALGAGRVWRAVTLVPGRRPLAALAAALEAPELAATIAAEPEALGRELHRRAGRDGLILFIDQLEELVTVAEPEEVAAFDAALARVTEGVTGVRLVATVRADFLPRLIALPRFGEELARVLYFVRPLPPERLHDVIAGPAAATAIGFESEAMVDELVAATAQAGSGGLPLLSFALAELWEARDRERGLITRAALDAMGGVAGALARHADSVLAGMAPADRAHARRVLLRLVTSVGTRVPRTAAELSVSDNAERVVAALVKGRLLVVHDGESGATYQLAHEVLVRGWGTLRDWLDADADESARRERLAQGCAEWERVGRSADATWRGPRLVEAMALDPANLTADERAFIAASQRAERARSWRRRAMVVGAMALAAAVWGVQRSHAAHRLADAVGVAIRTAHGDLDQAREARSGARQLARDAFAAFDASDANRGEELWRRSGLLRGNAARSYRAASLGIEAALAKDPLRADVRDLLGDVLFERIELERSDGDRGDIDELTGRLPAYDADGSRRSKSETPGDVTVRAPAGAAIAIDGAPAGAGTVRVDLSPGVHTIAVDAPGRAAVREPVLVSRGEAQTLEFAPPPAAAVPRGYIYIAPGTFLYGSAADDDTRRTFLSTVPLHRRHTDGFVIARNEVTFAEWLNYVDAQPDAQRAELVPSLPRKVLGGGVQLEYLGGAWQVTLMVNGRTYVAHGNEPLRYAGRAHHAVQDWHRFPMLGISPNRAAGYVAWLDRTGALPGARLCTELEWERAARGPDGRSTPSGRILEGEDANFDLTYDRDRMGPDEIGSHPASVSPYGLNDTAGNAFEWTVGERPGTFVVRGGSFWHDRKTADLANRNETNGGEFAEPTAGLRLCATPR